MIPERHDAAAPEPGERRTSDRSLPRRGVTRSEGLAAHQPGQGFRRNGQGLKGLAGHASDNRAHFSVKVFQLLDGNRVAISTDPVGCRVDRGDRAGRGAIFHVHTDEHVALGQFPRVDRIRSRLRPRHGLWPREGRGVLSIGVRCDCAPHDFELALIISQRSLRLGDRAHNLVVQVGCRCGLCRRWRDLHPDRRTISSDDDAVSDRPIGRE